MGKVKQSKLEKLLFEVYEKGVQNEDCDLTDFESKIKQALSIGVVDRDMYGHPIYCQVCDKHN